MNLRFALVVGQASQAKSEAIQRILSQNDLVPTFSNELLDLFADPSCPCLPVDTVGCVLGWLFHRHGFAERITCLTSIQAEIIAKSDGTALVGEFWGGYLAAIQSDSGVNVLRDPSGTLPCYYTHFRDLLVFASDADILVKSGVADASIDYVEIGRQLFRAYVPVPATALRGVRELLPGFSIRFPIDSQIQEPIWTPWTYVTYSRKTDAAERLSRIVTQCMTSWGSALDRPLLSVSGGLDSSIIAACLATSGRAPVCLTMYSDDPAGDEREYARALCNHLKLPLIECAYNLEEVDISTPFAADLPSPRNRPQNVVYERVQLRVAEEIGADSFVTGNAGDHIFGYSQSAAPIADRYLAEGLGTGVWKALIDVCRHTGCSMVDAAAQAWRLARGAPTYCVRPNTLFLSPGLVDELCATDLHHPWLDAPPGSLPGKAAHIATILRAQPVMDHGRGGKFAVFNPVMSQPIIEECLGVPTWVWRDGGRDRALARQAFERELPPAVLNRRVKGTPFRFTAILFDHFRKEIRERLLGGQLAKHGIIDVVALEQLLAGERPVPNLERVRILELVNVEAWIDHWVARNKTHKPAEAHVSPHDGGQPALSAGPRS